MGFSEGRLAVASGEITNDRGPKKAR